MLAVIIDTFPKCRFGTIKFISCLWQPRADWQLSASRNRSRGPSSFHLWLHPPSSLWSSSHSAGQAKGVRMSGYVAPLGLPGRVWTQKEETKRSLAGSPLASSVIFFKWLSANFLNRWTPSLEIDGLGILVINIWPAHAFQKVGRWRSYTVGCLSWITWIQNKCECFGDSKNSRFWRESHNKGKRRKRLSEPSGSHEESNCTSLEITEMLKIGKQPENMPVKVSVYTFMSVQSSSLYVAGCAASRLW